MFNNNNHIKFNQSIVIFLLMTMLFSCTKQTANQHQLYDNKDEIPLSETKNFHLTYTLKGNKVLELTAPVMQDFSNHKQFVYQYFPKHFTVVMIAEKTNKKTTVNADKAYIYKNPDLVELIGNVIITNDEGASLETSHLYWDSTNNHIFGEEKTILRRNDEKIEGIGFDSSLDFQNVRINKIAGQLKVNSQTKK